MKRNQIWDLRFSYVIIALFEKKILINLILILRFIKINQLIYLNLSNFINF